MISVLKSLYVKFKSDWRIRSGIVLIILMIWLCVLYPTDSFFSIYILYALICMISCSRNTERKECATRKALFFSVLFSALFSIAILLANYNVYAPVQSHIVKVFIIIVGGYITGWYILKLFLNTEIRINTIRSKKSIRLWFIIPFLVLSIEYLLVLFFCNSPGILTPDSISQVGQILSGSYTNHHPFWHTMIIKVFLNLGMAVFNDINMAVMTYHVFQIICMAAVFAFVCMTLYETGVHAIWVFITAVAYAVLPYHILYSMTMWKDILFGGAVALFICILYRLINGVGLAGLNYSLLALSTLGCCLLRSNGLAAFIVTFIIVCFVLRKKGVRILLTMFAVILISFVLKHPVLNNLDVRQPDTAEFLSIPLQQIARLIVDDEKLEENELEQIKQIVDVEAIKTEYKKYNSDPVKNNVRRTNPSFLNEHKLDYLLLWLRLGVKHPKSYLKAWIDQTKGYWNGGYDYWVVADFVMDNDYGITRYSQDNIIAELTKSWVKKFFELNIFETFRSIGLHVWTVLLCLTIQIIKKRKEALLLILPLTLILTLFITTPIFSEFRYAYAVFTAFPMIIIFSFTSDHQKTGQTIRE